MVKHYIACDLGAESGRVMVGRLADGRVSLEEFHRFPTGASRVGGSLRWNIIGIYRELVEGLRKVAAAGIPVASLSTDSWGVDYVLLRGEEPLLTQPFHYRDTRTDDGFDRVFAKVSPEEIFAETGIQFLPFNTIFQLNWEVEERKELLSLADGFLTIGDYFNYLFSGVRKIDESIASTTQLYNPNTRDWSSSLISKLGLDQKLFPGIVPSGTSLGPLSDTVAAEVGLNGAQVVATCSHDTGAAVAAVPGEGSGWAYLSSGTWSLLGIESATPIINSASREVNFTNEIGYGGTVRFLKNIVGLWIIQECRRTWAKEGEEYDYADLTRLASHAPALRSLIDPRAPRFAKPDDMPAKIAAYCRETGQPEPEEPGQYVRCVLESLALLYRRVIGELESVSGTKIERLHIVGGGAKNELLNQFSASATGREVLAGPVEATAIGNVLIQALALGDLASLEELRDVVRRSFPILSYKPQDPALWAEAYARMEAFPANL